MNLLLYLPVMQIMKERNSLKLISGPDPNYKDICFSGAGMYVCIIIM
jgi:hypothetical protein